MRLDTHRRRRTVQFTTVLAELPGYPDSPKCPFCGYLYDRTAPHLTAGGVGTAYAHVDCEQTRYCYGTTHMRHEDVEADSCCVYETGGGHAEPASEGGDPSSCGV